MAIQLPKLPFQLPQIHLGPRTRKIVRYVGLGFLALFVFVFAVQCTFPYDRVKDKVIESLQEKYDVTIGGVERGIWPGRVYFKAVSIRTRQTKPEETVTTFYINELQLDLSVMSMLAGNISLDLDAKIGAGELTGSIKLAQYGKGDIDASFEGEDLPGVNLPMRMLLNGLPMTGKLNFAFNIHLPVEKNKMGRTGINWQKARGGITLSCPSACTIGDGKTKLKPLVKNQRQQAMVAEGIDFGKVTMDSLVAKASIKNGKLAIDKVDAKSRDGELKVDFTMTLEKEFNESMVTGCLRFKPSDDLLRREPKTHAALSTTGAEVRSDGYFHIRLTDRFKDMRKLNQECGPGAAPASGDNFVRESVRPNLTVQPEMPGSAVAPPTPPIPADAAVGSAGSGSAGSAGSATTTTAPPPPAMQNEGGPPGKMPPIGNEGSGRGSGGSGSGAQGPAAGPIN